MSRIIMMVPGFQWIREVPVLDWTLQTAGWGGSNIGTTFYANASDYSQTLPDSDEAYTHGVYAYNGSYVLVQNSSTTYSGYLYIDSYGSGGGANEVAGSYYIPSITKYFVSGGSVGYWTASIQGSTYQNASGSTMYSFGFDVRYDYYLTSSIRLSFDIEARSGTNGSGDLLAQMSFNLPVTFNA